MTTTDNTTKRKKKSDKIWRSVHWLYLLFLVIFFLLAGRLFYIAVIWQPDPEIADKLTPKSVRNTIEPTRGSILSENGDILAMTLPTYNIYMDCTVQKKHYAEMKKRHAGDSLETAWLAKARQLSKGLAAEFGDHSADEYYSMIRNGRQDGVQYMEIKRNIERPVLNRLKKLPLFNEKSYEGGLIVETNHVRRYPYGKLARRTIGFIRDTRSTAGNTHIGLEGKFDHILHGKEGTEYLRKTDGKIKIRDNDRPYINAEDGLDIRTTLNTDMQDIADKALREQINDVEEIEGGCLVLMDVATGGIRAMVNLSRDSLTNALEETQNFAIGRRGEPGSVFKTVTLVSCLSDGYIKSLDETMPTNHGDIKDAKCRPDLHIKDWEREYKTNEISILDGFRISSNYVFATLAIENYSGTKKSKQFIDNLYMYKLGEAFDFDIEGLRSPTIPNPQKPGWNNTTLGNMGFGYSTEETPLHILTFYNALANGGKMMKPYLVESIEKHGDVIEKRGPSVLNASICSRAVADTVRRALETVIEDGTARRLKSAKCRVAGKTGTSFAVIEGSPTPYQDELGRRKYQGTFVGYFPAENPKYSIICTIYSELTRKSFQGGGIPALAVKTVVDEVYAMDENWREGLHKTGRVPAMQPPAVETAKGTVPDVRGLGLRDAVRAIESAGYHCSYEGTGRVSRQTPAPGIKAKDGGKVSITLK